MAAKPQNICILARKRLYRNTRVVRQAKALSEAGHKVTVVAVELPAPELQAMTPAVTYIQLDLEPWPAKLLNGISALNLRISQLPRRTKWAVRRTVNRSRGAVRRGLSSLKRFLAEGFPWLVGSWGMGNLSKSAVRRYLNHLKVSLAEKLLCLVRTGEAVNPSKWAVRVRRWVNPIKVFVDQNFPSFVRAWKAILGPVTRDRGPDSRTRRGIVARAVGKMAQLAGRALGAVYGATIRTAGFLVHGLVVVPFTYLVWAGKALSRLIPLAARASKRRLVTPLRVALRRLFRLISRCGSGFVDYLRPRLVPYMNEAKTRDFAKKAVVCLNSQKINYCQAHDTYALLAAHEVAKKTGAKIIFDSLEIAEDRSGAAFDRTPRWLRRREDRREKKIIRRADQVLAVGPSLALWTAEHYRIQAPVVIRNCCLYQNPKPSDRIRQDLGLQEREKVAVVVGSIYRDQGLEQLIESAGSLDPGIHIAAVGPEAQSGILAKLRELTEEKDAEGRFHVLPPQAPGLLISYLAGADAGLIARQNTCLNNQVSLPNKIFELIMARLPLAASRLPDIETLIQEYGLGLTFDETDPEDIARTINALFEPATYRRFKAAVLKAARELCWEREAQRYVRVIEGRLEENV